MKGIKRGLYIITFIISLFIINTNIKAYDIYVSNVATYTEKEVYEYFTQIEGFNINEYKNIFCTSSGSNFYCYSLTDKSVESLTYPNYTITLTDYTDCNYYLLIINKRIIEPTTKTIRSCSYNEGKLVNLSTDSSSNFNFSFLNDTYNAQYNVLDFSSYMSPDEEKEELGITIKGTQLLNFMIDKIKKIYEVLINNEIFKLILSIPLIYLCFILIYKFITNRR